MTGTRMRAYGWMLLAGMAATFVGLVIVSRGGLDPGGQPIGTDFAHYWEAARLAWQGRPADAWDPATLLAAQRASFGAELAPTPFLYPPPYLLLLLPLAALPYGVALAAWVGATGLLYAATLRQLAGAWLPVLAFPAVFANVTHGQNGLLTAALFGGAALLHGRHPVLSGVCLGLLSFKPHLGIAVIAVLLAARRWRTIAAATATVLAICAASLALGPGSWVAFFEAAPLARRILLEGLIEPEKLASVFGALRTIGVAVGPALVLQGIAAALVLVLVVRRAAAAPGGAAEIALMVVAVPFCSPYLFDYDLAMLAVPLAFVFMAGSRSGFLPWEKIVLLVAFVLPLAARPLSLSLGLPVAPAALAALLWVTLRRVRTAR